MRILMIAPTPFFADRGCHVRIRCEAEGLQALGHEVLVCTYPLGNEVEGIQTRRTWPVPWYRKLAAGPSIHKYYIDLMLMGTVRKAIKEWKPDILHAHLHEGGFIGALVNRRGKLPLVFDHQGSLTGEVSAHGFTHKGSLQHRLLGRIERWVERRADRIVTSTKANAESLRYATHTHPGAVQWLDDVIDPSHFELTQSKTELRRNLNLPEDVPVMIYVGVLTSYQGIDLMLEALAKVKAKHRLKTVIIGYPNADHYSAQARRLGLEADVDFLGRISFDALPQYLCAADLAISAKLPGSEGNGKLLTYMAAGLPVVAFDTLVNRQILGPHAKLVDQIDADALAKAICEVMDLPDQARRWSDGAKQRVIEKFGIRQQALQLQSIYQDLLKRGES